MPTCLLLLPTHGQHMPLRGCRLWVLVPPGLLVRISFFQIMQLLLLPHSNGKQTWTGSLQHYHLNFISKERSQEWRGLAIKRSCFSSREPEFRFQHPHWKSHRNLHVTPASEISHSSGLCGHLHLRGHTQKFKNNTDL